MADGRAAAVKVTKETLDAETREFKTVTVLSRGEVGSAKPTKEREVDDAPLCVTPSDLYSVHARERIGRLLDGWLSRNSVTPFELLHRPDLVEQLEASGVEIQHAVQKIAIPEAQARGISVHEMIRTFQKLIERAVERLLKDGRKEAFPKVDAQQLRRRGDPPGRASLSGATCSAAASRPTSRPGATWRGEGRPDPQPGRRRARRRPAARAGLPGAGATALRDARLARRPCRSPRPGSRPRRQPGRIDTPCRWQGAQGADRASTRTSISRSRPCEAHAARLSRWLEQEAFKSVRAAIGARVLAELKGPRRLRPGDAEGRDRHPARARHGADAASGDLLSQEDVQEAFVERSKRLVAADFVESFLSGREGALAEAQALVRLAENMAGGGQQARCRPLDLRLRRRAEVREGSSQRRRSPPPPSSRCWPSCSARCSRPV